MPTRPSLRQRREAFRVVIENYLHARRHPGVDDVDLIDARRSLLTAEAPDFSSIALKFDLLLRELEIATHQSLHIRDGFAVNLAASIRNDVAEFAGRKLPA